MTIPPRRVLVLGATGMLGHALLRVLSADPELTVTGTARDARLVSLLPESERRNVVVGVDATDTAALFGAMDAARPDVVVNCVGIVKQHAASDDPYLALSVNAILPHRLAALCAARDCRLIHISTDCVFSGSRGMYREHDVADAQDMYGTSKRLGEVLAPNTVVLRTSMIGRELGRPHGLLEWFLAQRGSVRGYRRAIFSGLPTDELARLIRDRVFTSSTLGGLYHVAAEPISKYELLTLIAFEYGITTEIRPDEEIVMDRSLDGTRFRSETGYVAPAWPELVRRMKAFH